jgi:Activator of Hsp90 ATPase homolog 1-like protein
VGPSGFTNTFNTFDFKVGGKWSFIMHGCNNDHYPNECEFIQIEKPNVIAWKRFTHPLFQMIIVYEEMEINKTKCIFKMQFENADECKKL